MKKNNTGFTVLEILVAIGISIIVTGAAMYAFSRLEHYRHVQERRLRYTEQAQSFFSLLQREMGGAYQTADSAWTVFGVTSPGGPVAGDELVITCALDSPAEADYAQVKYYVVMNAAPRRNGLYRMVETPGEAPPAEDACLFAPDVRSLDVRTDPDPVPGGSLPERLLAIIELPDPRDPRSATSVKWSQYIKVQNEEP
ncbi:MAG: type II secretion system protein [Planctomycetes bacterium]|nr:type II secretion system protein [Planctomycetota bacterium]